MSGVGPRFIGISGARRFTSEIIGKLQWFLPIKTAILMGRIGVACGDGTRQL
jgi:hypothetical protein